MPASRQLRDVTSGPGSDVLFLSIFGLLISIFLCLSCPGCKAETNSSVFKQKDTEFGGVSPV